MHFVGYRYIFSLYAGCGELNIALNASLAENSEALSRNRKFILSAEIQEISALKIS